MRVTESLPLSDYHLFIDSISMKYPPQACQEDQRNTNKDSLENGYRIPNAKTKTCRVARAAIPRSSAEQGVVESDEGGVDGRHSVRSG